jgi:hypothetical protein
MFPAVALASQAGRAAATAAVARDAAGIDPDAAHFQAAAYARAERAAAADRPALVCLPDSGTQDVEASADAGLALSVARTALHSRLPVAAAEQQLAAQRGALAVARRAVPASSGAAASASSDAVPRCADESWAARRDQALQA